MKDGWDELFKSLAELKKEADEFSKELTSYGLKQQGEKELLDEQLKYVMNDITEIVHDMVRDHLAIHRDQYEHLYSIRHDIETQTFYNLIDRLTISVGIDSLEPFVFDFEIASEHGVVNIVSSICEHLARTLQHDKRYYN